MDLEPDSTSWQALGAELQHWQRAGRMADLWWRDDDATRATPAFERLCDLAGRYRVPLAVAVIPARLQPDLVDALRRRPAVLVLQHGHAHRNQQPAAERKAEFGPAAGAARVQAWLRSGRRRLLRCLPERQLAVFVPPWNRIDSRWLPLLAGAGLHGLSTFKARRGARPCAGVRQVNCHVDIMDWRGSRGFTGTAACLQALTSHLRGRRTGEVDAGECTGLLSHHLVHDGRCWRFIEHLLAYTAAHPSVRWRSARELFP